MMPAITPIERPEGEEEEEEVVVVVENGERVGGMDGKGDPAMVMGGPTLGDPEVVAVDKRVAPEDTALLCRAVVNLPEITDALRVEVRLE